MRIYKRPQSRFYWIEFTRPDGSKVRKSSKTSDEAEARRVLQVEAERCKGLTFKEAVVDFFDFKSAELRPKTLSNYHWSLGNVDPFFGELALADIDTEVLKDFIRCRRRVVSPTTVRRDLAFVSSVFSHAISTVPNGPTVNPVKMLEKRGLKENARTRWLTPEEYQALLSACTQTMHQRVLKTAVYTGMRHGELTKLRKKHLDFNRKEIRLDVVDTKNHRPRVIPLCAQLCVELEQLCAEVPEDLVFAYQDPVTKQWHPYEYFIKWWNGTRKRAKVTDVRFHDLRHTFASWFVQSGGDLLHLRDILGHSSMQMVQRYAHLNSEAHHRAINQVFAHTFDTVQDNSKTH